MRLEDLLSTRGRRLLAMYRENVVEMSVCGWVGLGGASDVEALTGEEDGSLGCV